MIGGEERRPREGGTTREERAPNTTAVADTQRSANVRITPTLRPTDRVHAPRVGTVNRIGARVRGTAQVRAAARRRRPKTNAEPQASFDAAPVYMGDGAPDLPLDDNAFCRNIIAARRARDEREGRGGPRPLGPSLEALHVEDVIARPAVEPLRRDLWQEIEAARAEAQMADCNAFDPTEAARDLTSEMPGPGTGDFTDDGLALGLGVEWRGDARYVAAWGRWKFWDGARWRPDESLEHMTRARRHLRHRGAKFIEVAEAGKVPGADADTAKKEAKRLRRARTIAGVVALARSNAELAAVTTQWERVVTTAAKRERVLRERTRPPREPSPVAAAK